MPAPKLPQQIVVSYVPYDLADREVRLDLYGDVADQIIAARKLREQNGYVPVAVITFDPTKSVESNLEHAFRLMQNGVASDSWTLYPPDGLKPLVEPINENGQQYGHRSADIGDLFDVGGQQFIVARFGFKNINA